MPLPKKVLPLSERIKAAAAGAAPSMVPVPAVIPPPPEKEAAPDINQLISDRKLRMALIRTVETYHELGVAERDLRRQRDTLAAILKKEAAELGQPIVQCGEYRMSYSGSKRRTLNPVKLMEKGVLPSVIESCTDEKDVYTLRITKGKDEGEE